MVHNGAQLPLERCPHCSVAVPRLDRVSSNESTTARGTNPRVWQLYLCATCGGMVLTVANRNETFVRQMWPSGIEVSDDVPERAREYLTQAIESVHAPAGAIMLAAGAVDAMLKSRGLSEGTLYSRIDEASKSHLITQDMGEWAHEVRLEANGQRHSDEETPLPSEDDALRVLAFAHALAQFLFAFPAEVARGREGKVGDA